VRVWIATLVRLLLAAIWAWAGIAKVGNPAASVEAVRAYRLLPDVLERGIGYGLPFLALTLAVLLLVGLAVRVAAAVSAVAFLLLLAALVSAAARGLRVGCGCLGDGGALAAGQATSYPRDIAVTAVVLVLAVLLTRWPASRFAADDAVRRSAFVGVPAGPRTATARVGSGGGSRSGSRGGSRPVEAARGGGRRRDASLAAERDAARAAAGQRRLRLVGALAGVLLVVITGVGIGVQAARTSSGPSAQPVSLTDGVKLGRPGARVMIELYEDPLCANCATLEKTSAGQLRTWIDTRTATVKYYVVALLDGQSPSRYPSRAAAAMYCAADAGRFREYHDLLFTNEPAAGSEPTDDQLIAAGSRAGITGPSFAQCVKSKKYADFVSRISDQASRDGVLSTPTVLVDGDPVQNVSLTGLTAAVNAAL
jgi:protein-disulfide isomerase/uncharacterized membrane protein YphA (DoxX/SURF4 family)